MFTIEPLPDSTKKTWIFLNRNMIKPLLRRHSISTAAQFFEPAPSPTRAVIHQVLVLYILVFIKILLCWKKTTTMPWWKSLFLSATGAYNEEDLCCVECVKYANVSWLFTITWPNQERNLSTGLSSTIVYYIFIFISFPHQWKCIHVFHVRRSNLSHTTFLAQCAVYQPQISASCKYIILLTSALWKRIHFLRAFSNVLF